MCVYVWDRLGEITSSRVYLNMKYRLNPWHPGLECRKLQIMSTFAVCEGNVEQCHVHLEHYSTFCCYSCNRNVIYCSSRIMPTHLRPILLKNCNNFFNWHYHQTWQPLKMYGIWWDDAQLIQLAHLQWLLYYMKNNDTEIWRCIGIVKDAFQSITKR